MSDTDRREADREPLALDGLLSDDQRRLGDALGASKPLPASNLEECWDVIQRQKQTVTVDDHLAFQQSLVKPAQKRSEREACRVLSILDELGKERSR